MKKVLLAALLPFALISCGKNDIENEPFRQANCTDTTGQGVFERFTTAEEGELLKEYKEIPETEDAEAVLYLNMSSNVMLQFGIDYEPKLQFRLGKPAQVFVHMPYGQMRYHSWTMTTENLTDTQSVNIYNVRNLDMAPGCYRLFYIFSEPGHGKIYTKGHYDFTIK